MTKLNSNLRDHRCHSPVLSRRELITTKIPPYLVGGMIVCFLLSLAIIFPAQAEENISRNITLRIEDAKKNIINVNLELPEQCSVADPTTTTPRLFTGYKAICALATAQEQNLLSYKTSDFGWGLFVDSINDIGGGENMFWSLYKNNSSAVVGATDLSLDAGDEMIMAYVNWNYGNEVLGVGLSTTSTQVGNKTTLTANQWNGSKFVDLSATSTFFINNQQYATASGTLEYTTETTGDITIYIEAEGKTRSAKKIQTATPAHQPVSVNLRIESTDQKW